MKNNKDKAPSVLKWIPGEVYPARSRRATGMTATTTATTKTTATTTATTTTKTTPSGATQQ